VAFPVLSTDPENPIAANQVRPRWCLTGRGDQNEVSILATKQCSSNRPKDRAFNLTDFIAFLAVLMILGAVQWPSVANTKGQGKVASCLYNHRQLMRAWEAYAQDNAGTLVGNLDGGNVSTMSNSNRTWVLGWLDFNGGSVFPSVAGGLANTNTYALTQWSPLASYLGRTATAFKCPADTSLCFGTRGAPRVRSLSMNSYMGSDRPYTSGYKVFGKLSEINDPAPAKAFVFIDEREDSINDGVLQIDMTGVSPSSPSFYTIVDYPADWHDRGANLSFVDGHTETWRWRDPRTIPSHRRGTLIPLGVSSPNNPDVARIQTAASRRITN
jgi:prepilin-type processing-associated H-X9-DG protein